MSMEFANKICPNCKNSNYMVLLGDFSKVYEYQCMNCNRYFNDIDFEEPIRPIWKREYVNTKADMVEVVRCKYCKWYSPETSWCSNSFSPKEQTFFCADGKRREDDA